MSGFLETIAEWSRPEFKMFVREPFRESRDIDPHDWDVRLDFYLKHIPRYAAFSKTAVLRNRELTELFKTQPRNIAIAMQKLYQKGVVTPFSAFGNNKSKPLLQRLLFWRRSVSDDVLREPNTEWVFLDIFMENIGKLGLFLRSHYTSRVMTTTELHDLLSLGGLEGLPESPNFVRLLKAYDDVLIPIFEGNDALMGWVVTL